MHPIKIPYVQAVQGILFLISWDNFTQLMHLIDELIDALTLLLDLLVFLLVLLQ